MPALLLRGATVVDGSGARAGPATSPWTTA